MRRRSARLSLAMMLPVLSGAASAARPAVAAVAPARAAAARAGRTTAARPGPYTPASVCSSCHKAIHKYWSDSAHARSATGPVYLDALREVVVKAPGTEARSG